jgi:hypothetical protein
VKGDIVEAADRPIDQSPGCVRAAHVVESGWLVFLSYSRLDQAIAAEFENELGRRGHRVWRDLSNITVGSEWQSAVDAAIRGADHVIVLLTPESAASDQVEREIDLAASSGVNVVPVLLRTCKIPDRLARINCLDMRARVERSRVEYLLLESAYHALRQAVVFGGPNGLWIQPDSHHFERRSVGPQPSQEQMILIKDGRGQLGTIESPRPYRWEIGHLVSVKGIVYVVTDIQSHTTSSVELRVRRARLPG